MTSSRFDGGGGEVEIVVCPRAKPAAQKMRPSGRKRKGRWKEDMLKLVRVWTEAWFVVRKARTNSGIAGAHRSRSRCAKSTLHNRGRGRVRWCYPWLRGGACAGTSQ